MPTHDLGLGQKRKVPPKNPYETKDVVHPGHILWIDFRHTDQLHKLGCYLEPQLQRLEFPQLGPCSSTDYIRFFAEMGCPRIQIACWCLMARCHFVMILSGPPSATLSHGLDDSKLRGKCWRHREWMRIAVVGSIKTRQQVGLLAEVSSVSINCFMQGWRMLINLSWNLLAKLWKIASYHLDLVITRDPPIY